MTNYSPIVQAILDSAQNPYLAAANSIQAGPDVTNPDNGFWGNLIGGAAKGLSSAPLSFFGARAQAQEQGSLLDAVRAYQGGDKGAVDALSDKYPSARKLSLSLAADDLEAQRAVQVQAALRAQDLGDRKEIIRYEDEVKNAPFATLPPATTQSDQPGPNLGKSLRDLELERYQENLQRRMPPTQAAASARQEVDSLRDLGKAQFKTLAAEEEKIAQLDELVRKGEEGIRIAGQTGMPFQGFASGYEKIASLFGSEEATKQTQGDKLLYDTQQLGAAAGRIVGSGSQSDFETKALFNTAMSTDKTPGQNEKTLEQYKIGLERLKDRHSFFQYARDYGLGPDAAQNLWNVYEKENPLLSKSPEGNMTLNAERTPWTQYDFQSGAERVFGGGSAPTTNETVGGSDTLSAPPPPMQGESKSDYILRLSGR